MSGTVHCSGCGADTGCAPGDIPVPSHCGECPPDICLDCGGVNHHSTNRICSCWVSFDGMALADIKAVLARDESPGPQLTVGGVSGDPQ